MDLTALRSLKGLAGEKNNIEMQTLINVVYGLAIEVNQLKTKINELEKTPTTES